jgi:hypothetical protein
MPLYPIKGGLNLSDLVEILSNWQPCVGGHRLSRWASLPPHINCEPRYPLPTCLGLGSLPERFMGKQIVVCHLPWSTLDSLNNFLSTTTSTLPLNTATFSKSVNCVPEGLGKVFIKNKSIWKIFRNT